MRLALDGLDDFLTDSNPVAAPSALAGPNPAAASPALTDSDPPAATERTMTSNQPRRPSGTSNWASEPPVGRRSQPLGQALNKADPQVRLQSPLVDPLSSRPASLLRGPKPASRPGFEQSRPSG